MKFRLSVLISMTEEWAELCPSYKLYLHSKHKSSLVELNALGKYLVFELDKHEPQEIQANRIADTHLASAV